VRKVKIHGSWVVAVFTDGLVGVWDIQSRKRVNEFRAFETYGGIIQFNANDDLLAVSRKNTLTLWDVKQGKIAAMLTIPKNKGNSKLELK
jgi:WD40 repeat protein